MAARRLIAVLILLLVVSSLAAALAPRQEADQSTTETTTTTAADTPDAGEGSVVDERIAADAAEPAAIEVGVGDQLRLQVAVAEPVEVRIPGLGQSAFATPADAARFDLLLREAGDFEITVGIDDTVGRLRVSG